MGVQNGPPKAPSRKAPKSQIQDDSIMGTNNSSIVSKRSVERLYFPNEPHFFRYFVKKPQRRAPLINRGYWLRMKAIDQAVQSFLEEPSEKRKVVINLGCGYDPLPWQCFTRYPNACQKVLFIDIDYRDLMLRKRTVVQSEVALNSLLTDIEVSEGDVLFRSQQYLQVGCDLRDLKKLEAILSTVINIHESLILLTAEVSITYMNVEAADSLIQWCSSLVDARFCLLEQIMPEGNDHPFSQMMMTHFKKLQTPLHAVEKYPTTAAQRERFIKLGWKDVSVRNLWELWGSDFLSSQQRKDLDRIEPFDEWEEFCVFACHYFLLLGSTKQTILSDREGDSTPPRDHTITAEVSHSETPKSNGHRRFAAALSIRSQNRAHDIVGLFGGMGPMTRLDSHDEYHADHLDHNPYHSEAPTASPSSRMCHTISDLGSAGSLLVGGRTSPDAAFSDCWMYHKFLNVWERVDDLPWPMYRHQSTVIHGDYVLVSTGRINCSTISDSYLVWSRQRGWVKCIYGLGETPTPVFGQTLFSFPSQEHHPTGSSGIVAGGLSEDGVVMQATWHWVLSGISSTKPTISFRRNENLELMCRFGATAIHHQDKMFLVGGIIKDKPLGSDQDVCSVEVHRGEYLATPVRLKSLPDCPRPLFIGTSVAIVGPSLIVLGGSAVCFSFGTYWNKGPFTITPIPQIDSPGSLSSSAIKPQIWQYSRTVARGPGRGGPKVPNVDRQTLEPRDPVMIPRIRLQPDADFLQIVREGKPVIIEGSEIGDCTLKWKSDYLKQKIGEAREVIVHEARTEHMDFTTKNFSYTSMPFGEFFDKIEGGDKLYLRSLSSEEPSTSPTTLAQDFPSIASDFRVPPQLASIVENIHSSPLRISGPVIMWLHYDVMANILCQVVGSKRLILYPPSDYKYFGFEPGASSSSINVFESLKDDAFAGSHPHECLLKPGDILFIPPLWLHSASPTSTISIAVNCFFRNLQNGYAAGRDVYGNRDLQAYEKGRHNIARILASFENLPAEARHFYLDRLAEELKRKAC